MKAKANSQVVENCTTTQILVGHQISFSTQNNSYTLEEVCSDSDGSNISSTEIKTIFLPSEVYYKGNVPTLPIRFEILTGDVLNSDSVTLTNGSQSKTVKVDQFGIISDVKE